MTVKRNGIGRTVRIRSKRNFRRMHLQHQVTSGPALSRKQEWALRKILWRLLVKEGLTSRKYKRLVEKRTRKIS